MERLSQKALERTIIVLIGIVYGIVEQFVQLPTSVHYGIIITLLLFIAENFLDREISFAEKRSKKMDAFINADRDIHGQLLSNINNELTEVVRLDRDKFIIDHEVLAIDSYDNWWRIIVDLQEFSNSSYSILAIHSCEIDVWLEHPLTERMLNKQESFCRAGGKIQRILCGHGDEPNKIVNEAAHKMLNAGIEVYYFDLDAKNAVDHNFAWDYLCIEETKHSVIWDTPEITPNGVINEAIYCIYSEYKGRDLAKLWRDIRSYSKQLNFSKYSTPERDENEQLILENFGDAIK